MVRHPASKFWMVFPNNHRKYCLLHITVSYCHPFNPFSAPEQPALCRYRTLQASATCLGFRLPATQRPRRLEAKPLAAGAFVFL